MNNIKELMAQEEVFLKTQFLPTMHKYFKLGNPEMYKMYDGNACRQTSFLVYKYLSEKYPQMTFDVWEGRIIDHEIHVSYDHAWLLGTYRKGKKVELLLVDLPIKTQQTVTWTKKHVFPNETKMQVASKKRLNTNKMGTIVEFYTGMTGNDLYAKIMADIQSVVA